MRATAAALLVLLAAAALLRPATGPVHGQGGPTATAVLPPPDITGEWSVTRTWYRSCPACGFPVSRTTTWRITQFGINVSVDRGLRGTIVGAPDGSGILSLDGTEVSGPDVYRFLYASLRVSPDGSRFEGGFNGTESIQNPCTQEPPLVTCSASAGYLTARRVGLFTPVPTPPGPPVPTGLPTPFPLPTATPSPPASPTPTASATTPPPTATPSPTVTPTETPRPLLPAFLPYTVWEIESVATETPPAGPSPAPTGLPSPAGRERALPGW